MKKIKVIIVIIISTFLVYQLYYRINFGSVFIYTENNSFKPKLEGESFDVDLIWNDKLLTSYNIKHNELYVHSFVINKTFGKNILRIHRKDKDISQEYTVYSFLVTWIVIDINDEDYLITTSLMPPFFQ